ncbi:preprotein translocase, SecY subunit [Desulfarculus baarsii DSM 2075]|uniref:Protein translocase subunit SecY n=2 Tax=Desulfarculus baarsii TaxID=453230 RepID=E1QKR2_DESB2|nr:preprotein translocase, SecY subunit [Desulfarculus baarsii DSM 2075]
MAMAGVGNIGKIPELRKRVLFSLMMLAVYRIGCAIPTPGIDGAALSAFFQNTDIPLLGLVNMFSGGALERMSIFALGIMPYISASIILDLLTVVVPRLAELKKEGQEGRKKITQYARYGTVLLSLVQGMGIAIGLESMTAPNGALVVPEAGWGFRLMTMITLTSGTAFIMWLGEQITERGIGNGISLIIFAGIVASLPAAIFNTFRMVRVGEVSVFMLLVLVLVMVAVVAAICFVEQGQRRIPVQYAKRVVGRRVYGGQTTHLPLKINTAGVIPPIFASSIIMFPATIAQFVNVPIVQQFAAAMTPDGWMYNILYVGMIVFFCYFYTAVTFNPTDVADNMKKYGGFIPGIRPGKRTADYIDRVLTRLTLGGAAYISAVCVLPTLLITQFNVPFYFGGTALLIVVGVSLDTMSQIESHLMSRHYESLMKKGVIKGR